MHDLPPSDALFSNPGAIKRNQCFLREESVLTTLSCYLLGENDEVKLNDCQELARLQSV